MPDRDVELACESATTSNQIRGGKEQAKMEKKPVEN